MVAHLYIEIQLICITFFVVLLFQIMRINDRRTSQLYFRGLLISSILCFAFDLCQAAVGARNPAAMRNWLYLFNVLYYVALGFQGYFWFLYSEAEQDSDLVGDRGMRIYIAIPLAILVVLALTAPLNHMLFWVSDAGGYVRGHFHWVQLCISYLYVIPTALKAFYLAAKANDYAMKSHLRITGGLIIPTAVAGAMQFFLPSLPILCAGCCDSLLFGYLALQEENVSVDPLTKVGNRRRMLQALDGLIGHARDNHTSFGLLIIDVDKFKSINDTYGHVEGDNALVHVAKALTSVKDSGLRVYRYGGDEFVVLSDWSLDKTLSKTAHKLQQAVAEECIAMEVPYKLSISVGYTSFEFTDANPSDIVSRADTRLYEEKHAKTGAKAKSDGKAA